MKITSTTAVTNGETHHRSVRNVRAEIAARAAGIRPGGVTPDGGDDVVVVMTSLPIEAEPVVGSTYRGFPQSGQAPPYAIVPAQTDSKTGTWHASKTW